MIEECLTLHGHERLEARLAYDDGLVQPHGAVLICPPHPFLGGDMDNNVVVALAHALAGAGLPVLRFNYRGIGQSTSARDLAPDQQQFWTASTCPDYEAEIRVDCHDAFVALCALLPEATRFAVVGYSFGCLPALEIATRAPLARLCLISPPLAKWALPVAAAELPMPSALCYAPDDFACPESLVTAFAAGGGRHFALHRFADADHFFIGHEQRLAATVVQFLTEDAA